MRTAASTTLTGPNVVFASQVDEVSFPIDEVDGQVPRALRGTALRIGPGLHELDDVGFNFFDALGMVSGVVFDDGAVRFVSRHVRTPLFEAESTKWKMKKRRAFTNFPSRWANLGAADLADPVNHDVYTFAGRVFATGDSGHWAVDPTTLKTMGKETFGLKGLSPTPMTKTDPATGRLIFHAARRAPLKNDVLSFVEIDDRLQVVARASTTLGRFTAFVHDVAFTPRWYVAFENPGRPSIPSLLSGARRVWDEFASRPGETPTLHLVPRGAPDGRTPIALPLPGPTAMIFHVANAYDDGDDVVIDFAASDGFVDFTSAQHPRAGGARTLSPDGALRRARASTTKKTLDVAPLCGGALKCVQPEVNEERHGRRHRFVWSAEPGATAGDETDPRMTLWYHDVAKADVEQGTVQTWSAGPKRYVAQPSFAPTGPAEDDGFLLAWTTDAEAKKSQLVVLDARDLSVAATLHLGLLLPGTSHAKWAPGLLPA